jgi:hypothetical protein
VWHRAFYIILLLAFTLTARSQVLTYPFTDPCTKVVTTFTIPVTGNTTIYFLGRSASFTAADVSSGAFAIWVDATYTDYRKVSPCGQQSGQVTQNQITSQIIGNTVQSVVGSIMSSAQSQATSSVVSSGTGSSGGASNASSKNNKDSKSNKNGNSSNSSSNSSSNNQSESSTSSSSSGETSSSNGSSSSSNSSSSSSSNKKSSTEESQEVAASTTMSADASADKSGGDNSSSSKGGGKSGGKGGVNNPIIISSDFTTAQNLDKTFTPILNLSMSQSSLTGKTSWGMTGMIWFNFKQFALSGKYTKMSVNKSGKLKYISNVALTAVYSYGNILGFIGYSGILNAGKYGVTGFNLSGAASVISEDDNTFFSPSITAFYTKPFYLNQRKRLTISPELYIISTPLIYSTKDKVTQSDRTFSFFAGSGFDYQISKRFKVNLNYKLNASTNREFPILSFFLIGSKVNL